jgi:diguanylate cyclase (GGDEF)-like protein
VVNLALGFAIAVCLSGQAPVRSTPRPGAPPPPRPPKPVATPPQDAQTPAEQKPRQEQTPSSEGQSEDEPEVEDACEEEQVEDVDPPLVEQIPADWVALLDELKIKPNSFLEASIHVLRLEVGDYRDRLVRADRKFRSCRNQGDSARLRTIVDELNEANAQWLAQQAVAAEHLREYSGRMGELEALGQRLQDVLQSQTEQIQVATERFGEIDIESDLADGCQGLLKELRPLLDLAHSLRDEMLASFVAVVQSENRLMSIQQRLQFDPLTQVHNRMGLEKLLFDLQRNDLQKNRLVSIAMIDIDGFGELLLRHGAVATDRLLSAFAALLTELVRKNRGLDVIARYQGQRFVAVLADTGPRRATSAMERMRQSIANTTFMLGTVPIELNVSSGVTEMHVGESSDVVCERLCAAVQAAQQAGHNRTVLDEGAGPSSVDPPRYDVKARVIRIDE